MNPSGKKRRIAIGLIGALLVSWAGWSVLKPAPASGPGEDAALISPPAAVVQPAMQGASSVTPHAASGGSTALAAQPTNMQPTKGSTPQQLAQIEAQWCTHAQQAHQQAVASIEQSHPINFLEKLDKQRFEARVQAEQDLPTSEARWLVRKRLKTRWIEQLRAQGDPRSLATASFLTLESSPADKSALAFQAEAASTRDPYVLQLWRAVGRYCETYGGCQKLPKERWAQVEPSNALAWLAGLDESTGMSDAQWQGLARASYASNHTNELRVRLLNLLATTPPGLELEVGLELVGHISMPMDVRAPSVSSLAQECRKPEAASRYRKTCLHASSLFWDTPQASFFQRGQAMALASGLSATAEPIWAARLAELEALGEEALKLHVETEFDTKSPKEGCGKLIARKQRMLDMAKLGPWHVAQQLIAERAVR